jgi:L-phenylalanine/L-methionine N-acetyltransferase
MTLTIRRATTKDAAAFARIMGDPAIYPGLMQLPYTNEGLWAARLADFDVPGKPDLPLVAELNGEVVGSAGLHPTGPAAGGRPVVISGTALCDYADRWLGTLRIELNVYTDNEAALALYRKFDFVIEGTQRGYALRDGQYVDSYTMARFHPNPPTIARL